MEWAEMEALLSACPATRCLVGRVKRVEWMDDSGEIVAGIEASSLESFLRELVAIVDMTPNASITAPVRFLAERARGMIDGVAAFATHGMEACGQGDA